MNAYAIAGTTMRIKDKWELVLDKEKVASKAVFRFKECDKNGIIGRMDFVESILRRGIKGIKLTELEVA